MRDRSARSYAALCALAAAVTLRARPLEAIVSQVNGQVVPQTARLQACLDKPMTGAAPGEGSRTVDALRSAGLSPQYFLPNPTGPEAGRVTFTVLGEGADYQNRFGWYEVGRTPYEPAQRHEVFDCRGAPRCDCPCPDGPRARVAPTRNACTQWLSPNTVRVDFNCLRSAPGVERYSGGPIAFYLLTPERLGGGDTGVCAPVDSTTNRVYATDSTLNDDGDYVHFLVYESVRYPQAYYFGFEDLFRGGDNDFEDLLVRATGLVPSCNPEPEACDNRDNNCDGVVDDFTEACSSSCGSGTRRCTAGVFSACTAQEPRAEVCDGLDNDCDGQVDEGVSRACVGACGAGTQFCLAGAFGPCVASRAPTTELCDGVDNDCDGVVDNGLTRPCRTACGGGVETCRAGAWGACDAPAPGPEVCDGRDNDCNGVSDDGIASMGTCGRSVGVCRPGTLRCVGGALRCAGGVEPSTEVCNGLDDDCDGAVDEGAPDGGPCGRTVGACTAGTFVCEAGRYVCRGGTQPSPEVCNNRDDDCNGLVDDGIAPGGMCSVAVDGARLCAPGQLRCRAGRMLCEGGTRGTPEVCDCEDNDCNGQVDEGASGGMCPGGACIACACRTPCRSDSEFPCSPGLVCREGFCVPPICGGRLCRDDEVCVDDRCVDPCSQLTCSPGQTCVRGRCVEESCYLQGCPGPNEVCVDNRCVEDRCRTRSEACPEGTFCRDGDCITSCADVACDAGQSCRDGVCVADPCAGVRCERGFACDPSSGACVEDPCRAVSCGAGRRCREGRCVDDVCARVTCPGAPEVRCVDGQCTRGLPPRGSEPAPPPSSGCACATAPGRASAGPAGPLAALLGALAFGLRARRRQRRGAGARVLALGASLAGACTSEAPPCPECSTDAGDAGGARSDVQTVDVAPGCVPREEACNGLDDNCDGVVDEPFDVLADPRHCGGCGLSCALPYALPRCVDGRCVIDACDVGRFDRDRSPQNGCEYACVPTGTTEQCDGVDNNCDGATDEGFDTRSDPAHCGGCFRACLLANATAACREGACHIASCASGFQDRDGDASNGCESACEPSGPEVCDGRDNNCDGRVDEGFDLLGDVANCGACGRRCAVVNGVSSCTAGACVVARCNPGFSDDTRVPGPDCLLACGDAMGARGPEVCDGFDNDCNGVIDDGALPGVGVACGTAQGACMPGRSVCERGAIACAGGTQPAPEVCDGVDNDCDGAVDEAPLPGFGAGTTCGSNVGACAFGTLACVGGRASCTGARGPSAERCNGVDDDCDGAVDEELVAPASLRCNPRGAEGVGVCASGVRRVCAGASGFRCVYPESYRDLRDEALCDGLDNNCDGRVDEGCLRLAPAGGDVRLDRGAGNSVQPALAGDGASLAVAYTDRRDGDANIYVARSGDGGASWAPDVRVDRGNGTPQPDAMSPALAASSMGLVAVWSDGRDDASRRAVYATRASAGGGFSASDVRVSPAPPEQLNVRVALRGADAVAVWESLGDDRSRTIFASTSRDDGATFGAPVRVSHAPAGRASATPALALGPAGRVYVAWRDDRNGRTDVYFNRSDDVGRTFLATDVRLDTDAPGAQSSEAPSLAADDAGNVFVAWSDTQTAPHTRFDVYTRRSTDFGRTFDLPNVRAETDPIPHDSRAPVALAVEGSFVVLWLDERHGRANVFAARSADRGARFAPEVRLQGNAPGLTLARELRAASTGGSVFAVWTDEREAGARAPRDVYANYSLDGGATFQPRDVRLDAAPANTDSEAPAVVALDGAGHFAWVDRRANGLDGDVYYRALRP